MKIFILKIDHNLCKNNFKYLAGCISKEKVERINKFCNFEDSQRSLLGDILARYLICKALNISNRELDFCFNEYGKPMLKGHRHNLHFNVSHSGEWVACVIHDSPVGVDVETIKTIDIDVVEQFFSKEERLCFFNQPDKNKLKYFYTLWTMKESFVKAEGKGLHKQMNSFSITSKQNAYFYQKFLSDDAVFAVCSIKPFDKVEETYYTLSDFLKTLKNSGFPPHPALPRQGRGNGKT